jgi:hypothetical protein
MMNFKGRHVEREILMWAVRVRSGLTGGAIMVMLWRHVSRQNS